MLKKCLPVTLLFLLTLWGTVQGNDINEAKGVRILKTTDKSLTIEFSPQNIHTDTIKHKDTEYLKVDFHGASFDGDIGYPVIPNLKILLGVPQSGTISHSVSVQGNRAISGIPLPHFDTEKVDNLYQYKFNKNDSVYSTAAAIPGQLLQVSEPKYFRDQRVVQVTFYPVQCELNNKRIQMYDRMIVNFEFNEIKSSGVGVQRYIDGDDRLYQNIILNDKQARNWRKARRISNATLFKRSVYASGDDWYKISIRDEGMYRITGKMMTDYGIDIKAIEPSSIRLYNNGGTELSMDFLSNDADSLIENAIRVVDGGDGQFDATDYILFYGKANNNYKYNPTFEWMEHYLHHYEEYNVYWLTWGGTLDGKRMENVTVVDNPAVTPEPYFYDIYFFEQEIINVLGSGRDWYSRLFSPGDQFTFSANLPHALPQDARIKFKFVGWTSSVHNFTVHINQDELGRISSYGIGDFSSINTIDGILDSGLNQIKIAYESNKATHHAYLDYFEIFYRKQFIADDDLLIYNIEPNSTDKRYQITGFSNNDLEVYDVTDFNSVKAIVNITASKNQISYFDNYEDSDQKRMIALSESAYKIPERVESVELYDLRRNSLSADFIIITHDDFYDEAIRLAQHRESNDSLETVVVKISDIYNEFSWGLFDPTAIRNFLRYAYENWAKKPSFVLLFGDGDYDHNNVINEMDKNWIPTYQTTEKDENRNRTFDDWFVRVSGTDDIVDIYIGRLPIRSADEARIVVDKIIKYEKPQFLQQDDALTLIDDWRNNVTMVADDELIEGGIGNETIHMVDAENIIDLNRYVPNRFNKNKVYLTEYPALRNVSYFSALLKPAAMDDIIESINNGTLIINYIGHGNPITWSHEYVLYEPRDFEKIQNGDKLSFWVAATCDFGRFDDPSQQGLAENLITVENRGAIGVLASTRAAYATNNAALNRAFYLNLFKTRGQTERLGQALFEAKLDVGIGENAEKYVLLGDPTMRLAVPQYGSKITSINPDTIKALSRINVKGYVTKDDKLWSDFNGKILMKVSDSKKKRLYTTEVGTSVSYNLPGNMIFKGIGTVEYGEFDLNLIVPKDITYGGNLGRISLYFVDESIHGWGYKDSLRVGGTESIIDNKGPEIEIGFKDQLFYESGYTNQTPVLKVNITDTLSGVNIVGDIGHHISMTLNQDETNKVLLTDLFQYNENSYTSGSIYYDFSNYAGSSSDNNGLPEGRHTIEVKAWDNSNNSSVVTTDFTVVSSSDIEIRNVLNYPNPFSSNTTFTFWANQDCMAKIKIYTVAGRLIYTTDEFPLSMNEMAQVKWDGRDEDGDEIANGVYFYKVIAKATIEGKDKSAEALQKLLIVR